MAQQKTCSRCGETKPIGDFSTYIRKNRNNKVSIYSWCKPCKNETHDPLAARKSVVKVRYNLSWEEYTDLFMSQDEACAVCGAEESGGAGWHVDHDHGCCPGKKSCGKCVRGILCHACNTGLGNAKDSIEILRAMIAYLEKTSA
jgi:hypothetical protein